MTDASVHRVDRVVLAEPRGFCAGVEMAIKALAWMVRILGPPVYCYHEIVHNQHVVNRFRELGVVFVDDVADVPAGAPLMLSAHGSAPEVVERARQRSTAVVDAVCPLVAKVHHELRVRAAQGFRVLYVGHAAHDEAVATLAIAPHATTLVEAPSDIDAALAGAPAGEAVALLAQTTISYDDWLEMRAHAVAARPDVWTPGKSDLCFATTNRQAAVKELARRAGTIVVVGSPNSSNTNAIAKVAADAGATLVVRVDDADELPPLTGTVGVIAGASAPESVVRDVVRRLDPAAAPVTLRVVDEEEYFPPPRDLRSLLADAHDASGLEDLAALLDDDRHVSADELLDLLFPASAATAATTGAPA